MKIKDCYYYGLQFGECDPKIKNYECRCRRCLSEGVNVRSLWSKQMPGIADFKKGVVYKFYLLTLDNIDAQIQKAYDDRNNKELYTSTARSYVNTLIEEMQHQLFQPKKESEIQRIFKKLKVLELIYTHIQ